MRGGGLARAGIKALGLTPLVRRLGRGGLALFYHGVVDGPCPPGEPHLPLEEFAAQMRLLQRRHRVVSLDELAQTLAQGRDPDPRQVLITFDDGYLSHLTLAAPLLNALGLPFALFVNTEGLESGRRLPTWTARRVLAQAGLTRLDLPSQGLELELGGPEARRAALTRVIRLLKTLPQAGVRALVGDLRAALPLGRWAELEAEAAGERPLTWPQLDELRRMGATIGSHCHEHAILHPGQPAEEVRAQLTMSRDLLAARLGSCRHLAYPNGRSGDCSPAARAMAAELGYGLAFTTEPGRIVKESDRLLLPRLPAPAGPGSLEDLEWMLARQR